ncbi:hypothetical protein CY34DRAFT_814588, partial [Suillus luteus UH-Slu-Lm8-n1]
MSTAIEAPLSRAPTSELMDLKLLILTPYRVNRNSRAVTSPSSRTSLQRVRRSTYPQLTATVPVRSPSHIPLTIKTHLSNIVAVTRLYRDVAGTASAESTSQLPMLARLSEPVVYRDGRENIILNGNTFGSHVMINIGSHHCTGA